MVSFIKVAKAVWVFSTAVVNVCCSTVKAATPVPAFPEASSISNNLALVSVFAIDIADISSVTILNVPVGLDIEVKSISNNFTELSVATT